MFAKSVEKNKDMINTKFTIVDFCRVKRREGWSGRKSFNRVGIFLLRKGVCPCECIIVSILF